VIKINLLLKPVIYLLVILLGTLGSTLQIAQAGAQPTLGTAENFQIVSGAATVLGASLKGLDTGNVTSSSVVVSDVGSAIATLSATPATSVPADLGGSTFAPGAYSSVAGAAFAMTSSIILDGKNSCDSKFIFITPAAMNTTAGVSIFLINGAKASNVYWVVGAAVTVAASGYLAGNFLSSAAITVGAGSSINGRFLAMQAVSVGASVTFLGFPIEACAPPAGGLSISVPESIATRNLTAGDTVEIDMGSVVVTDTRGIATDASWDVSTVSEGVRDSSGNTLGGGKFSYSFRGLSHTGGITLVTHAPALMATLTEILSATSGSGNNSATWTPVITVTVPFDQSGGTYSGSITHSVS